VGIKAKILIVDDEAFVRRAASQALRAAGYQVLEAETGRAGLERARTNHLDLILLDRALPDADGLEVCRQIKADPATAHSFVVLLSSLETPGADRAGRPEAGADGCIARPIGDRELVARVNDLLRVKRAEDALRQSEARFRTTFERAAIGMCLTEIDGRLIAANRVLCRMLGYGQKELLGRSVFNLTHPDDLEAGFEIVNRMLAGDQDSGYLEKRYLHKDGRPVWVLVSSFLFRTPDGETQYFINHIQDITERKRVEEELRRRVAQQEALNAVITAAASATDLAELLEDALARTLDALGLTQGCIWTADRFVVRGLPPEIDQASRRAIGSVGVAPLDIDRSIAVEDWHRSPEDGLTSAFRALAGRFGFRATLTVPLLTDGQPTGGLTLAARNPRPWPADEIVLVEAIGRQLGSTMARLQLLERTREQAFQVQQIISTVPEGVVLLDADLRVLIVNPAARRFIDALTDARWSEVLTHLGGRPIEELLTSPPQQGLWHELTVDGPEPRVFEMIARPLENGALNRGWVLVLRDVTQERAVQQQMQQQERLAAVGQLAAGIAHDFNNIMAVILLYSQMGLRKPDLSPDLAERFKTISGQANRATALIQQILDFSRHAVLERRPLSLIPFLKEVVKLLERTLPESIAIELSHGADEYMVEVDPTRLQQVIMNLAVNARDAMPHGGRLRIGLERVQVDNPKRAPLSGMEAGEWLRMAVSDTGVGIPAELLPRIFDPFFTTKSPGQGTGLGLAQVYGIVAQHGGHIDVTSQVEEGTTFVVYLPALSVAEAEPFVSEKPAVEQGQGETVLLVEDDAATREALADTLELLRYRVLTAANGGEALAVYRQRGDEIDLVLSDVVMPEMGGVALFHALKQWRSDLKMVLLTGHSLDEEWTTLEEQGLSGRLRKPPSVEQLAGALRQALADKGTL
jgi:PAS domain S-box-containing protein